MLATLFGIIIVLQCCLLHAERRDHRRTHRALIWWRDERLGHHGHSVPPYYVVMADGAHVARQRAGVIDGHRKCDGDHALPICDDLECWQRDERPVTECPACGGAGRVQDATGTPSEDGGEAFRTVDCEVCCACHL